MPQGEGTALRRLPTSRQPLSRGCLLVCVVYLCGWLAGWRMRIRSNAVHFPFPWSFVLAAGLAGTIGQA